MKAGIGNQFESLRETKTILLTTYKRDGTPVAPVSIAFDGAPAFFGPGRRPARLSACGETPMSRSRPRASAVSPLARRSLRAPGSSKVTMRESPDRRSPPAIDSFSGFSFRSRTIDADANAPLRAGRAQLIWEVDARISPLIFSTHSTPRRPRFIPAEARTSCGRCSTGASSGASRRRRYRRDAHGHRRGHRLLRPAPRACGWNVSDGAPRRPHR